MDSAIVEIKEYKSSGYDGLNRGVRVLPPITKGSIIGEYTGKFLPLQCKDLCGDDYYSMNFDGLPYIIVDGERDYRVSITVLVLGLLGNWSRFMNDCRPKKTFDAQFCPKSWGRNKELS